jgi:hypothetical protein
LTISDHALYIGGDATMGQFFDGRIDEVRVYDLARTQEQILEDMNTSVVLSGNAPPIVEATADRSSGTTLLVVAFSSGGHA